MPALGRVIDELASGAQLRAVHNRYVLEEIGRYVSDYARGTFDLQRMGVNWEWPERYPSSEEPFINVAGALADFASGRMAPKSSRFDRRPAILDTGSLRNSIHFQIEGRSEVTIEANAPHAAIHQFGLVSTQRIDEGTKRRISAWLLTPQGEPHRAKMMPLLKPAATLHMTEVNQRPFVGIPEEIEDDIRGIVQAYYEG